MEASVQVHVPAAYPIGRNDGIRRVDGWVDPTAGLVVVEKRGIWWVRVKPQLKVEIKLKSVQTQLNSIYYTELHVLTYFRSFSGSQFVFKTS
jgi:hypothetical protein